MRSFYLCPNEKEELNNCKAPDHETERLVKKTPAACALWQVYDINDIGSELE